ncbi:hypothetical protein [Micromonospora maritima]|uniref:hypothetical protein n=1 Tax=Micromonospora maritima TaxID=986711 RepID=UPI00157C79E0|nr:hypothetical protein [Micromonospora maritima]
MTAYLLGYTEKNELHVVAAERPTHAVCGARLVYVPQQQPASPFVHEKCQNLVAAALAAGDCLALPAVEPVDGVCASCGGDVALDEAGLVTPHNQVIMRGGRLVVSDQACAGAGAAPEEQR